MPASQEPNPLPAVLAPIWNVPYNRNPNFTGRKKQLDELFQALTARDPLARVQAIHGLGGVGKTQLALEYAYCHADEYAIVWWLRAEESTTMMQDFIALGNKLSGGIKQDAPAEMVCDAIRRALDRRRDWLLILDNAPGPEILGHVLPQARSGNIIITSRHATWRGIAAPYPLEPWPREESVAFLKRRTGLSDQYEAARLAETLGDLPLALEQAGACIEQGRYTFTDYLDRFQTHRQELMRLPQPVSDDYPDTIATAWDISFEKIRTDSRAASDLLNLCAFLCPDEIRRDLLFRGAHVIPYPLATTVSNAVMLDGAVSSLLQYSLIDANQTAIALHRLVAAVTRDRLVETDRKRWSDIALRLINDTFAFESIDVRTWQNCAQLMPHVMAVTGHAEQLGVSPEVNSRLLNEAGRYLLRTGRFAQARELLTRALELARKVHGDKHAAVSAIVNDLGRVHGRLGNTAEARKYYEWALGIDEPIYGHDHPHVATIVNNYGMTLMSAGDLDNARKHFEWALNVYRKHYGENHAKTASVVSNLGYVLLSLGDASGAHDYFEQALGVAEAALGEMHPTVASIWHNLGQAKRRLSDLAGAQNCFQKALNIDSATYVPTHPDVCRDVDALGEVIKARGDAPALRTHYHKALDNVLKVHDAEHPRAKALRKAIDDLGIGLMP